MKPVEIEHRGDSYYLDTQEKLSLFNEMIELEKQLHKPAAECLSEVIRVAEISSQLLTGKKKHIIVLSVDKDGSPMKVFDNVDKKLNN